MRNDGLGSARRGWLAAVFLAGGLAVGAFAQEPAGAPAAATAPAASSAPAGSVGGVTGASGVAAVRGRVVDGTAMMRSLRPEDLQRLGRMAISNLQRIPVSDRRIRLHVVDGPARGRVYEVPTDAEGRFSLSIDASELPATRCLVVEVEGEPRLYSPAVAPAADEVEFKAYSLTDNDQAIDAQLNVIHSLVENPVTERMDLEVEVSVSLFNASGEMYVGRPALAAGAGSSSARSREVLHLAVPSAASVLANAGPGGERWSERPAGSGTKWIVLDTPIPPVLEDGNQTWQVRYRVPARQEMVGIYSFGLPVRQFAAWAQAKEMGLEATAEGWSRHKGNMQARPGEPELEWSIVYQREVQPGAQLTFGIHVDNARIGQVNRGSFFIVLAFFLAAGLAIGAGLLLGPRAPGLESLLSEASGDELLTRIAELDMRRARGQIGEKEHRETREKLVSMARYLVPELSGAAGGGAPAGSVPAAGGYPPAVRELLERLRALESEGSLDAKRIHERAVLLDALAKALLASSAAPSGGGGGPGPGGGGGGAVGGGGAGAGTGRGGPSGEGRGRRELKDEVSCP